MAIKLQFDSKQPFQEAAVAAVVDLFAGQPQEQPSHSVIRTAGPGTMFSGQETTELGVANRLIVDTELLRANVRTVQARNDIDVLDVAAPLEGWSVDDPTLGETPVARACPQFSIEMETGTGKTYVYLRTILELSQKYGFQKFVIVVPSVAIREGVLKNLEITADHFRGIYDNLPFESFEYDARRVNRLRQFATSNALQIMVINIDRFRREQNVMYKDSDRLSGRSPLEFVQATRPIVLIDEPQSVDSTEGAREAIRALNPLCALRYSATHRDPYNLIYRLDPVQAFELGLVKQIVVASAVAEGGANEPFVRLEKVDNRKGISARLRLHKHMATGPKEASVTARLGSGLLELSGGREQYRDYSVSEINAEPGNEYIRFTNGRTLALGESIGGMQTEVWRIQIRHTVERHLEKERQLAGRGIKVLSLFFIDRVANYRDLDAPGQKGKFARVFEEELARAAQDPRNAAIEWLNEPVERLHNGYFSQDKKGVLKDSREGRASADDEGTYNLIMKDKERLLDLDEPLRFIFSHSALREGWDNPNVFQICTLNESVSTMKKRQEIGRGLRLPVNQDGERIRDEAVNRLYVMANESYEEFAKALQTEYEEDCGVTFGKVPRTALARLAYVVDGVEGVLGAEGGAAVFEALVSAGMMDASGRLLPAFEPERPSFALALPDPYSDLAMDVVDLLRQYHLARHIKRAKEEQEIRLKKEVLLTPEFQALWEQIKPRTTYRVEFDTDDLVAASILAVKQMPAIQRPTIVVSAGRLTIGRPGVQATGERTREEDPDLPRAPLPDVLAYLQRETDLTRSTLARILAGSGRLDEFFLDPQHFMDQVAREVKAVLHGFLVNGIRYERLDPSDPDSEWEMRRFEDQEQDFVDYLSTVAVRHSLWDYVRYDSQIERKFAEALDQRDDIKLFVKLPRWFTVDTPVGTYNPDWAIVKDDGQAFYLVRETKGTKDPNKLRTTEREKVSSGRRHFEAIGVDFEMVATASEV